MSSDIPPASGLPKENLVLDNRTLRYTMFGLLYFAQGAILSYFTALNALYLLSFDLTMSQVGIFSAIALTPFVLKIFLGMLSDRVNLLGKGHRKPYIILGLLIQAGCLLIVPFIHPGNSFELLAFVAFVLMTGMALYDTCTDGLALDTTPPEDEGTVQGIMVGGRALGVVIVSAALGLLAQLTNWTVAFWSLGLITLIPLALVVQAREPARPSERAFEWKAFRAFGRRHVIALALLGALYSLVINGASEIVNPFLEDRFGIGYLMAGLYTAVWGVGVVLGGLTGGRLTDRIGHKRAAMGALVVSLVAILALAAITGPVMAWPLVFIFGLAFGYYETVYFATSMDLTDPRIAASMFAILMAVANIGTGVGLALGGGLVDAIGYRWTFVIIAALNLLALPLIPPIFRRPDKPA
jgi:PAT family beta-lactamase induction signal transducer AmpG